MEKYSKKQFIPGYTGHVPSKINVFGISEGQVNQQLVLNKTPTISGIVKRDYYTNPP